MARIASLTGIKRWTSFGTRAGTALSAVLAVALIAVACGDPQVPQAISMTQEVVPATLVPLPPTPTPLPIPTPTPTPEVTGQPVATPRPVVRQPGLSADVIRLAVIFDDETAGISDQLFRDAWLGALAWQNEVNGNGGLGGRNVEVVPLDARLFDHQSALEDVCDGDFFAIVGSHSLGDSDGAEILGTEECFIADFAGEVYGAQRAASDVTILANPFLNDVRQAGPARYLLEEFPEASQNVGLIYYDALDLSSESERQREMLQAQGLNVVADLTANLEEDPAERIALDWDEAGAESLVWTADPGRLIDVLDALDEKPAFVLCEWGCYSQQFLIDGGETVDGVYTWIAYSPFDSPQRAGDLLLYQFNLASVSRDARWSEVGLQSWMAGRFFEASFNTLLQVEPEAPTREALVQVAKETVSYVANGILSFTNPAAGEPTACFVLMVVRNGRWQQEFPAPTAPRDQDCSQENLYRLGPTSSLGVGVASSTTSAEQAEPVEEETPDLDEAEDLDE